MKIFHTIDVTVEPGCSGEESGIFKLKRIGKVDSMIVQTRSNMKSMEGQTPIFESRAALTIVPAFPFQLSATIHKKQDDII